MSYCLYRPKNTYQFDLGGITIKVLVVGATGVLGKHLIPRLVERGHKVRAIIRNPRQEKALHIINVDTILGNILDQASLREATRGMDVSIHIATAIPKSGSQDWSLNDRIRREGTQNLLEASSENGVKKYIQQSITLLYGENGQSVVDESMPIQPSTITQSATDMEEFVRSSKLDWCILRGGLFYGPGTGREQGWREDTRQGRLNFPGDGSDLVSLVHVIDMARAIVVAIEKAPSHSLYNIVDNQPVSYRDLFSYIAVQVECPLPKPGGKQFLPSLGCSNEKARQELGWQPLFPSYLSGLA